MEIKDNELLRQFEIETDKGLLSVEYSLQERRIFLTRLNNEQEITQIDSNDFIKGILELVRERKLRVVPTHPKIVSFFRKKSHL